MKIIISGGGTGGHIFPAISIANELMHRDPLTEILFVGALGRMEMQKVPDAGYKIVGLPVSGLQRRHLFKNIKVVYGLLKSIRLARKILEDFKPDIAIGVGGYASGPLLREATKIGIPTLLQEQNSYAGITNKLLAKNAARICVAYKNMERYFPADKIVHTGNPVRDIVISEALKKEGYAFFNLKEDIPVLLLVGGSLGARTLNETMLESYDILAAYHIQVIWQTGDYYFKTIQEKIAHKPAQNIHVMNFISRMDLAYNVADLMISRAGAISISEICLAGRAAILVPSPNVAEDHQTSNAMALVADNAAELVPDKKAIKELIPKALKIIHDTERLEKLAINCKMLAKPDATAQIVNEVYDIIGAK